MNSCIKINWGKEKKKGKGENKNCFHVYDKLRVMNILHNMNPNE